MSSFNANNSAHILNSLLSRITCQTDGKPNEWSQEEQRRVVAIWRAVAEDYAGFDVDVTTGAKRRQR